MWPPELGDVIGHRWQVTRLRHEDEMSSRKWYDVKDKLTGSMAICEIEWTGFHPGFELYRYAKVVKELTLSGRPLISRFIEFDSVLGHFDYLVTKSVGPTLKQLRESLPPSAENRFSLFTCLHIGMETLIALKELHEAGYLHRNLKPDMFALEPSNGTEFVILFAAPHCIRRWQALDGESAIPPRPRPVFFSGNVPYASLNALDLCDEQRMDGIWSWFYLLIDLTRGSLPWPFWWDTMHSDTLALNASIKKMCLAIPSMLLNSTPPEYSEIFTYINSAPSQSEPNYQKLFRLVKEAMGRTAGQMNGDVALDWEPGGLYYEQLSPILLNHDMHG